LRKLFESRASFLFQLRNLSGLKKEVLKVNFYFKRGCGGFGRN